MKDKRLIKINQHIDEFINDSKFKVLSCQINSENKILRIKTKIRGQKFPCDGAVVVSIINEENITKISAIYHSMYSDEKTETWEYKLLND